MSFNVTQCPACASTFNTNSRVLSAAAGRVRCGACLNVFEAIDNFLIPDEADEATDRDESVFVGNDPQEYFDPSSFLTRSALRASEDPEPPAIEPTEELEPQQGLDPFETVNEGFFASVAEELHGREIPMEGGDESQTVQPPQVTVDKEEDGIDEQFEEAILDSFTAMAFAPAIEAEATATPFEMPAEDSEELAVPEEQMHEENSASILGADLSASFTFDSRASEATRSLELDKGPPRTADTEAEQPQEQNSENDTVSEIAAAFEAPPSEIEIADETEAALLEQDTAPPSSPEELATAGEAPKPNEIDQLEPAFEELSAHIESSHFELAHVDEERTDEIIQSESATLEDEPPSASAPQETTEIEPEIATDQDTVAKDEPLVATPPTIENEIDEDSTEAIRARALEAELNDEEALEAIPRENLLALGNMSTPLEFLSRRESRLLRSTLLFFSILILGGLLSAQYLWRHMDIYSQLAQLRPLYELSCNYLGCELPQFRDIDSIRSENLTVQTHPSFANGLMVNTIIRNTAAFEQPFPILILSFNSAQNSVIALREFSAAEYLDPGLRSVRTMPARTPVQIDLAIMDPGPEAVNYTLAFRWP